MSVKPYISLKILQLIRKRKYFWYTLIVEWNIDNVLIWIEIYALCWVIWLLLLQEATSGELLR